MLHHHRVLRCHSEPLFKVKDKMNVSFKVNRSSWKKVNSNGEQFHQYQQNEQAAVSSSHWTQEKHDIWQWKSRSWVGKVAKCGGVKPIMGSQNTFFLLLDLQRQYTYKWTIKKRPILICSHTKNQLKYELTTYTNKGQSWSWSYSSWIYNYPCYQDILSIKMWVRIPPRRVYSMQHYVI